MRESYLTLLDSAGEDEASSLLSVLVVVVISTVLIGTVLSLSVAQDRMVARDVLQTQAFYAAEGGLESALAALDGDPSIRGQHPNVLFPDSSVASASIRTHGAVIQIVSQGTSGRETVRISALVGEGPGPAFESAIWIGDPTGGLNLAGTSHVSGPIVVGASGVTESVFRRMQFRGSHDGSIVSSDNVHLPEYQDVVTGRTLEYADSLLAEGPGWEVDGSTIELDSTDFARSRTVVVHGSARIAGEFGLPDGARLIVRDTLSLGGRLTGRDLIFFGGAGIHMLSGFESGGQFISRGPVVIGPEARLYYPSIVYTSAESPSQTVLDMLPGSRVDGTVIVRSGHPQPDALEDAVHIRHGATIAGVLFSERPVHHAGSVFGSLIASSLRFYESPTVYVNWLVDAVVHFDRRPAPFVVPPGFSQRPTHRVIARRTVEPEEVLE